LVLQLNQYWVDYVRFKNITEVQRFAPLTREI
jgi:hypothetical protein